MFVEPAVFVGEQRFDVERRDVFGFRRVAPDAVVVGERAERSAVAGEDDGAAAGGVGLIVCQWAKALGATVIGTVGSEEKAELARAHGCDHPILYTSQDFAVEVDRITNGVKLPVVYDSIGKDTFQQSLNCLAPKGLMVTFGNASGPVPPVEPGLLAQKGSLFLTRPTLFTYTAKRAELEEAASELFDVVASGKVKVEVKQRFPLKDAAEAHRALEARETSGSTVLTI